MTTADSPLLAFAGLFGVWEGEGESFVSCTVLTTTPNEVVSALHDRMPAILEPGNYDRWLDPALTRPGDVLDLLRPFAGTMRAHSLESRK